jgi:hypothetical protein
LRHPNRKRKSSSKLKIFKPQSRRVQEKETRPQRLIRTKKTRRSRSKKEQSKPSNVMKALEQCARNNFLHHMAMNY